MSYDLHHQDAFTWLTTLGEQSVDMVITDPPYESLEKHRTRGTTPRLVDWFPVMPNERFLDLFTLLFRVMKQDTHLYMFCDQETAFIAKPVGESVGFRFWKPLVWNKQSIGMGYHYRTQYEFILFFEKGKRKLTDLGIPDVLSYPRVRGGYPTEKPEDLLGILVNQSSSPGDLVLDPFMGSGSTGAAAIRRGRRFAGTDVSDNALWAASIKLAILAEEAACTTSSGM